MYKDKDKQREADRARQKRRRDRIKAEGVTNQGAIKRYATQKALLSIGVTGKALPDTKLRFNAGELSPCLEPRDVANVLGKPKRSYIGAVPEVPGLTILANPKRGKDIKIAITGKPGDADYNGICTKEWRAERGRRLVGGG